jgi:hypothetical protein
MSPKVAAGALTYAAQHGANRIFCGHTHEAIHVQQDGIDYYNSGGWVDSPLTYLTIDEQGVQIHDFNDHEFNEHAYDERADDRHPGEERGETDSALADVADESGLLEDVEYENISS